MGQVLSSQQWVALALLSAGVGLIQTADGAAAVAMAASSPAALAGISAVLGSAVLSGFANVYFEKARRAGPPPLPNLTQPTLASSPKPLLSLTILLTPSHKLSPPPSYPLIHLPPHRW